MCTALAMFHSPRTHNWFSDMQLDVVGLLETDLHVRESTRLDDLALDLIGSELSMEIAT